MKKKVLIPVVIVLLMAAGFCLYMESHFTMSTMVDAGFSEERILREMPEIALSERDLAMGEALLSTPEVQEALPGEGKQSEIVSVALPVEIAEELLADWKPEGYEILELAVTSRQNLYVSFVKEEQSIYYTFFADGSYPPQKTIGIYGRTLFKENTCKAIYENINGEISKLKFKHVWFAWLREEI